MKLTILALLAAVPVQLFAASSLTYDQQEAFLRSAKITAEKPSKKGVTGTVRVTLTDGKTTHDASVQRVNEHQAVGQNSNGQTELNLYDKYIYNVAAWKLARMLGIEDMVPPSVERNYQGVGAAFTWWIDDVLMDEEDRVAKKVTPPDSDTWGKEIQVMRVYDQLLYNIDSNATNLLIDKQWNVWLIDHTRSFRPQKTLMDSKALVTCDRNLLAKMKALNAASFGKEMKNYLDQGEIQGLLARRDLIVKLYESKGDSALYDRPARR